MSDRPTKTHPFKSRYADGLYVTPAQFLAEAMCRRRALRDGADLPRRFWLLPKWKREFALQARLASQLLSLYSYQAVCRAMRTREGQKIYSFGARFIDPLVEEQERVLAREAAAPASGPPPGPPPGDPGPAGPPARRPAFPRATTKSKLRDL